MSRRIVVGLSTIPSRIKHIGPTLESLHRQTMPPDLVLLAVPRWSQREQRPYVITSELAELERRGLVAIERVEHDWGPGTKLLGCLQRLNDDDIFIAFDDDSVYRNFAVEELVRAVERNDGAASFYVYENRGLRIGQGADGFAMRGRHAARCREMIPLIEQFPELRMHDDYWISFVLSRHGVAIADTSRELHRRSLHLIYEPVHAINSLMDDVGPIGRGRLNKLCHHLLFRHAGPSFRMRAAVPWGLVRGFVRRARREGRHLFQRLRGNADPVDRESSS